MGASAHIAPRKSFLNKLKSGRSMDHTAPILRPVPTLRPDALRQKTGNEHRSHQYLTILGAIWARFGRIWAQCGRSIGAHTAPSSKTGKWARVGAM